MNDQVPDVRLLKKLPPAPAFLDKDGQRFYTNFGRMLLKMHVACAGDMPALSVMAQWWDVFSHPDNWVLKSATTGAPYIDPRLNVLSMAGGQLAALTAQFGMLPAAREKVRALNPKQASLFDDLINNTESPDGDEAHALQ